MKFLSFEHPDGPRPGLLRPDGQVIDLIAANAVQPLGIDVTSMLAIIQGGDAALSALEPLLADELDASGLGDGVIRPLSELKLTAPIPRPTKNIFCVGRNYLEHVKEGAQANQVALEIPKAPHFFTKPPTAVIGHDATIRIPARVTEKGDYEVELGVVIGKSGVDITPETAEAHIFGYTIVNDVTGRDLQRLHTQWFKGKGLDTSCPIGPVIVTRDELGDIGPRAILCRVNGEERQRATMDQMMFDVPTLLASLSNGMTLESGDIIATGTPSGVGFAMEPPVFLKQGDVIECEIEGIGVLRNHFTSEG